MACGFADAVATAFGAGGETLERGALLDVDGFHLQLVDVGAVVVFSVGDGGLENLLDDARSFFLREGQDVQRLIHFFTANQIGDQAAFIDRQTDAPEDCTCLHGLSLFLLDFFVRRVTLECPGQCEFAQFVANHLVGHINRNVLLAVVNGDGQTDEIGQNHGATRPCLNGLFVFGGNGFFNLGQQVVVNEWTLFERACHCLTLTSCDATRS